MWGFWLKSCQATLTVFALQYAVFEEVNDRDALLLVESAHRGRGHGLREPRLDVVRQIRVLLRDLEEDGEVARAEAVPGVKEMGEERERRRLPQGQSVTQIWPEDNIEELKWKVDDNAVLGQRLHQG